MSRYIGKRVSYECGFCKKQFTLNKQSVDDSEKSGEVFCSKQCSEQFYLSVVVGRSEQLVCDVCGSTDVIEAPYMGRNCNRCNPL